MIRLGKHHVLGLVLVFALLIGGFLSLVGGTLFKAAQATGDCGTIRLDAIEARARGDIATAGYRDQEAQACEGVDLDKSKSGTTSSDSSSRHWEFLANRPAIEKTSINSFGPMIGLLGNSLKDIADPAAALAEWQKARQTDPMQTAAAGAAFGLWGYDEVDGKTKAFSTDFGAWDEANATIDRKIDEAKAAGQVAIVTLKGTYTASYAIPGEIPSVRVGMNVARDGQSALRVNGHLFQLQCLFQEYWESAPPAGAKAMPAPSPGMSRNPEGTPVKLVSACRLTGGTWTIVRGVAPLAGDLPVNSPKCKPPTSPPTTSTPSPSCSGDKPHGTWPACKDGPEKDPASQSAIPTQVVGTAPAAQPTTSQPSVTRQPTSTYSSSAPPAAPTTARTTSAPPVEVPSTTATGTVADG